MKQTHKLFLMTAMSLSLLGGCGFDEETQNKQKIMGNDNGDRHQVKEFYQHRAFTNQQNRTNQHQSLSLRIANEAERVFGVGSATAIIQGNDIILGITVRPDGVETPRKIVERVRQRIEAKEPSVSNYNLYITDNAQLQTDIHRISNNMQNANTPGYTVNTAEPNFSTLLDKIKNSNRNTH